MIVCAHVCFDLCRFKQPCGNNQGNTKKEKESPPTCILEQITRSKPIAWNIVKRTTLPTNTYQGCSSLASKACLPHTNLQEFNCILFLWAYSSSSKCPLLHPGKRDAKPLLLWIFRVLKFLEFLSSLSKHDFKRFLLLYAIYEC